MKLISLGSERVKHLEHSTSAVALPFEEMRTPYASGKEILRTKFGNAYQRKANTETNAAFQKNHSDSAKKKFFANDPRFLSYSVRSCLVGRRLFPRRVSLAVGVRSSLDFVLTRPSPQDRNRASPQWFVVLLRSLGSG